MIYYIHGFNSSTKQDRLDLLSNLLGEEVQGLNYDSAATFSDNVDLLQTQITNPTLFIGTSLGGFYSQVLSQLYDTQSILINPALHPVNTLEQYLGENTNYVTNETMTLTKETINSYDIDLTYNTQTLVILAMGDTVIDNTKTIEELTNKVQLEILEGGNHSFDQYDEVKDTMITFINTPVLSLI